MRKSGTERVRNWPEPHASTWQDQDLLPDVWLLVLSSSSRLFGFRQTPHYHESSESFLTESRGFEGPSCQVLNRQRDSTEITTLLPLLSPSPAQQAKWAGAQTLELKSQPLPACGREAQAVWCCPGTGPWRSQHLPTWPTKEGFFKLLKVL